MDLKDQTENKRLTANVKAGGCAAKLGAAELAKLLANLNQPSAPRELITGMANFEDAAVWKISEEVAIIQTIDFFPPLIDDPYLFGQIAATNALSDVYAMGGRPILALNVLCFPTCDFPPEVLTEILKGGADQVALSGAVLAGGHSIQLNEPVYGLAVTGVVKPQEVLTNGGAHARDKLVLTKPLGTGVALLGTKAEMLSKSAQNVLIDNLTMLNGAALSQGRKYEVHALTDVTGFGLAGHVHEMAKASGLKAGLHLNDVALLPEVKELAQQGLVPAGAYGNRESYKTCLSYINKVPLELEDLIFDPQTSGGLLFALAQEDAEPLRRDLELLGLGASMVGEMNDLAANESAGLVEIFYHG